MQRWFRSLRARLLAVSTLVMLIFTAAAVGVLDNAFESAARNSVQEQLNAQLYALLTAAEITGEGEIFFPERLAEPRFSVADSGLYAFAYDGSGGQVWRSSSAVSPDIEPAVELMGLGSMRFNLERTSVSTDLFVLRFGVAWESVEGEQRDFTILVAEDLSRYRAQVSEFRRNLYLWSTLGLVVLMILQLSILHWALRPLSVVAREIHHVEQGSQQRVEGEYPVEIARLTGNINRLIDSSQRSLQRYRNSLGDLAHSLKTQLAVLRGLSEDESESSPMRATLREHTRRMADIVDYQLKRAASSAGSASARALEIRPVADKIIRTLDKVHADRNIDFMVDIDDALRVKVDEGDLMEVLGNLAENACKWCRSEVRIHALAAPGHVEIRVEDDGPGIDSAVAEGVLARGVRADQKIPGYGIGLSVVRDIVDGYDGRIVIGRSALGGASVVVHIPVH